MLVKIKTTLVRKGSPLQIREEKSQLAITSKVDGKVNAHIAASIYV